MINDIMHCAVVSNQRFPNAIPASVFDRSVERKTVPRLNPRTPVTINQSCMAGTKLCMTSFMLALNFSSWSSKLSWSIKNLGRV